MRYLKMFQAKFLICVFFIVLLGSCSNKEQSFSAFINDIKSAAEQEDINRFNELYSKGYRRADSYLYQPPNLNNEEAILDKAKWLMKQRVSNSEVLRYENEILREKDDVFKWSRRAIYSENAKDYIDVEIDFVLLNGEFKLAPHFSHPTQEQLDKLEKMDNRYVSENVSGYEVFINEKEQVLLNENAHVINLYDIHKGQNTITFKFKREDTASPISFAASLSFIEQGTQQKFSEKDKVFNLHGEALNGEDVFGRLEISDDFLKKVEGDEISFNVKME
jgi:hypothetical protein